MMETTDADVEAHEFEPALEFWGGPLDGLVIPPGQQRLPDRTNNLFRAGANAVWHDPDGPGKTMYALCMFHRRMEAVHPEELAKTQDLTPEETEDD